MIPVAKPWLGNEEVEAVKRPIMSGWVTQGPEVAAFEKEFAQFVGAAHACAVSSCTTALHLALRAVGVAGGEVITLSHSFLATADTVRFCDAIPVLVDIDPQTYNIDPALMEAAITPKTQAILVVHQMGMPCDMYAILKVAKRHSLPVVEDAACAAGSEIRFDGQWEKIGKPHGHIACFSFHPRKLLTTGDGGMITTNNPEWDKLFRLWRQHCMSVSDVKRHASNEVIFEEYIGLGYNYRMTDLQAAMGREQLKKVPTMIERRRQQAKYYMERLSNIPGLVTPFEPTWARSNYQSFCVRLPTHIRQKTVMQAMLDQNIATRRGVMNAHREPAYRHVIPWLCGPAPLSQCAHSEGFCVRLTQSANAQDHCIVLPLFHEMTDAQQDEVVAALKKTL